MNEIISLKWCTFVLWVVTRVVTVHIFTWLFLNSNYPMTIHCESRTYNCSALCAVPKLNSIWCRINLLIFENSSHSANQHREHDKVAREPPAKVLGISFGHCAFDGTPLIALSVAMYRPAVSLRLYPLSCNRERNRPAMQLSSVYCIIVWPGTSPLKAIFEK